MRSRLPSISAVVHLLCYKGYRRHVTHLCASGKADLAKSLQEKTTTPTAGLLFFIPPYLPDSEQYTVGHHKRVVLSS